MQSLIADLRKYLTEKTIKELESFSLLLKQHDIHLNVYKNPTPVVVCIVPLSFEGIPTNRYLLIRRNNQPGFGGLAFPGGYLDEKETVEQAAARELFEETKCVIPAEKFKLLCSRATLSNNVLIFAICDPIDESQIDWTHTNEEVQSLHKSDETSDLCFPLHQEILTFLKNTTL